MKSRLPDDDISSRTWRCWRQISFTPAGLGTGKESRSKRKPGTKSSPTASAKPRIRYVRQFLQRGAFIYAYYNNHYGGFSPGSITLLQRVWTKATGVA